MATAVSSINGVDLQRLVETVEAIKSQPSLARFLFRLSNEWINGGHTQSMIRGFYGAGQEDNTRPGPFFYATDEQAILLGEDNAPNPVEYVLHALAGCLTASLVYHAAAKGYKISNVRSTLEGELDLRGFLGIAGATRNGYKEIRVSFEIEGDLTEKQKIEILEMGPSFSPVFDIITQPVPVKMSLATMDC